MGRQSAFIWMVKPQAFAPQPMLADYMHQWIDHYRDCGGEHARLPGQRGAEQEQRAQRKGIELPESLTRELSALGTRSATGLSRLTLPFPQDLTSETSQ